MAEDSETSNLMKSLASIREKLGMTTAKVSHIPEAMPPPVSNNSDIVSSLLSKLQVNVFYFLITVFLIGIN